MNRLYKYIWGLFLIVSILIAGSTVASSEENPKTFIVIIDRVLPQELLEYGGEDLKYILENSSWAILSNVTGRGKSSENQAMTIGSASRAVAPNGNSFF